MSQCCSCIDDLEGEKMFKVAMPFGLALLHAYMCEACIAKQEGIATFEAVFLSHQP